jgi:hypothetical protein
MTAPMVLFGFLLASFYGALFHLWKDGGLGRLILFVVLSWLGFIAGLLIGQQLGWTFWTVGKLHVGMASLTSLVFLIAGNWLSHIQTETKRV